MSPEIKKLFSVDNRIRGALTDAARATQAFEWASQSSNLFGISKAATAALRGHDETLKGLNQVFAQSRNYATLLCALGQNAALEGPSIEGFKPEESELYTGEEFYQGDTPDHIVVESPAIKLIEALAKKDIRLTDIDWREFEEIVAELLHREGYQVNLGRGTKDGGCDIQARLYKKGIGEILSVWQAKHSRKGNKVGIGTIRELADTTHEMNASKGIIVTSTSLTGGAIRRIQKDCFKLGKIDGIDLQKWLDSSV